MTPTKTVSDLLEEEKALRGLAEHDQEGARKSAQALAERSREALEANPLNPTLAALLLRSLRRAKASRDEIGPLLESLPLRFPESQPVLAAANWLLLDEAKARAAAGDCERAVELLSDLLTRLPQMREPSYLAMGLLGGLRGVSRALAPDSRASFEAGVVALDLLLDTLEAHGRPWIQALPLTSSAPKQGPTSRGTPGPRLMGCLLLRSLCRQGERHALLQRFMQEARDLGVHNEWLLDGEVEALERQGNAAEALALVREARQRYPQSEGLARHEARLLSTLGQEGDALAALQEVALASRTPWAWRDLARYLLQSGRPQSAPPGTSSPSQAAQGTETLEGSIVGQAMAACRAALAFQDPHEPGPVWGLHFELAQLLMEIGNEPEAAEELWLAREARLLAGWGVGSKLQAYLDAQGPRIEQLLDALDRPAGGENRRKAIQRYRSAHAQLMRAQARPAQIISLRERFGFLKAEGLKDNVFFPTALLRGKKPTQGEHLLAVIISSFDPKKHRKGYRAVWLARP